MVIQQASAILGPPQDGDRRTVGRGVSLNLQDVPPVAGGRDVRHLVSRRVFEAYVEVARQMTAYLAARNRVAE
jgi:hypothetical protein